jgi:hypothetical protein
MLTTSFSPAQRRVSHTKMMCICIDCARVTNCAAYHLVETKHHQPHINPRPTFEPRDGSPTIHVNIRTVRSEDADKEIKRMWAEHADVTRRVQEKAVLQGQDPMTTPLFGDTVYSISPTTTYEYDVVQCEDYVHDKGCWIRNMPEEIKLVNPSFVPT